MRGSIEGAYEIANLVTRRLRSGLRGCVVPPRTSRLLPFARGRAAVALRDRLGPQVGRSAPRWRSADGDRRRLPCPSAFPHGIVVSTTLSRSLVRWPETVLPSTSRRASRLMSHSLAG